MADGNGSGQATAYLVVVDDTPECSRALRFAALRATRIGASLKLVHVVSPTGFLQWGGVQKTMEDEVAAEAMAMLQAQSGAAAQLTGCRPDVLLRHGKPAEEIRRLVEEDDSIRCLVLAAAAKGRPGPLIEYFASAASELPCLVMVVPGGIDDEALERLT